MSRKVTFEDARELPVYSMSRYSTHSQTPSYHRVSGTVNPPTARPQHDTESESELNTGFIDYGHPRSSRTPTYFQKPVVPPIDIRGTSSPMMSESKQLARHEQVKSALRQTMNPPGSRLEPINPFANETIIHSEGYHQHRDPAQ